MRAVFVFGGVSAAEWRGVAGLEVAKVGVKKLVCECPRLDSSRRRRDDEAAGSAGGPAGRATRQASTQGTRGAPRRSASAPALDTVDSSFSRE